MDPADDWDADEKGIVASRFFNARYATVRPGVLLRIEVLVSAKPHKARGIQMMLTAAECRKLGRDLMKLADTWDESDFSPP